MLLLFAVGGCPTFETVEEACRDTVIGEDTITDPTSVETFRRIDCYRHLAGLTRASFDSRVQEADAAHAAYLSANAEHGSVEDAASYDWWSEVPSAPGFTGEDSSTRLASAGYPITGDLSPIDEVYLNNALGAQGVDDCMGSPGFREFVLRPAWMDGGWSSGILLDGIPFSYGTVVVPWVSSEGADRPIPYPVDGQRDVPTTGVLCDLWDPRWSETTGFAFTLTFATDNGRESYGNAAFVEGPDMVGPDGAVSGEVRGLGLTWQTLVFLPDDPLAPDSAYTVTARVRFGSWEQAVDVSFHTAAE